MQPETINALQAAFNWYILVGVWMLFSVFVGSVSLQTGCLRDGSLYLEFWDSFTNVAGAMFISLLAYFGLLIIVFALDGSDDYTRLAKYSYLPGLFLALALMISWRNKIPFLKAGDIAVLACQAWQVLSASILGYGALGWIFLMALISLLTGDPPKPEN